MARIDVSSDFIFKANKNGSVTLQYGNPEGVHGLIVNVDRQGSDDLKFLDLMGADAAAGGPGNLSIIVRSESPQRLTLMEEFLHGTQSRMWGDPMVDANGAATAFREWHVRDFMNRHSRMFGWDQSEQAVLQSELKYWAAQKSKVAP